MDDPKRQRRETAEERKAKELNEDYRKGRVEIVSAKEYLAKRPELSKYIKK